MCISTTGQACSATTPADSGSWASAETSLTILAPAASAARMVDAFRVSTDTHRPSAASARMTGSTRSCSTSGGTGAAPGPGAFAADIDDVRAIGRHGQAGRDGVSRIGPAAAVAETVRRDVEDAHDERPVEVQSRPNVR